jgi:hypothetical protein
VDPYSFDFMVKDRIRELAGEAAGQQRITIGKKRHLRTWLVAVVHLWSPSVSQELAIGDDLKEHDHDLSA